MKVKHHKHIWYDGDQRLEGHLENVNNPESPNEETHEPCEWQRGGMSCLNFHNIPFRDPSYAHTYTRYDNRNINGRTLE